MKPPGRALLPAPAPHPYRLHQVPDVRPRFAADGHLGRLARILRMLGFDTHFQPAEPAAQLQRRAMSEGRILLSRRHGLTWRPGLLLLPVFAAAAEDQFRQIDQQLLLAPLARPFSRCMDCNGLLEPVHKAAILHRLQPGTARDFEQFRACPDCGKVYWEGGHYERMLNNIRLLL